MKTLDFEHLCPVCGEVILRTPAPAPSAGPDEIPILQESLAQASHRMMHRIPLPDVFKIGFPYWSTVFEGRRAFIPSNMYPGGSFGVLSTLSIGCIFVRASSGFFMTSQGELLPLEEE